MALEPQRAFEIEVVGRLVEQQDFRLEEQHGAERHAHAPAAGELPAGAAAARLRRSRGRRGSARRAPAPSARRCRSGATGSRRCGAGRSPFRPRPAGSRVPCRLPAPSRSGSSSPPGASCATWPMRALRGVEMRAVVGRDLALRSAAAAWSCRRRCGRRGRPCGRAGMAAVAPSRMGLPSMR